MYENVINIYIIMIIYIFISYVMMKKRERNYDNITKLI